MTETKKIANQTVTFHCFNTIIVGSGAAGMNCAVHLCDFMTQKGITNPAERIHSRPLDCEPPPRA